MFDTTHHSAFDKWWEFASVNYVTWDEGDPVALDLYYDPIVDEHVGRSGVSGIIAPAWYLAPQKPEVALAGWQTIAQISGVFDDRPLKIADAGSAISLLQLSGEFASATIKQRIWEAAEDILEPTWDVDAGEFTLGLGLNEPHPRGQLNARIMAGWVCAQGAWSNIFNEPNLGKFDEPTVEGVDFPRVSLSEARWDGTALHLAVHPQNAKNAGTTTRVQVTNLDSIDGWSMTRSDGTIIPLSGQGDHLDIELVADNQVVVIGQG